MAPPRSVLFVGSECAQLVKSGGLGDVMAALPAALRARGIDARIVLPRYDAIPTDRLRKRPAALGVPMGIGEPWCAVYETELPGTGVPVYLLDHLSLFGRGYLYDPPAGHAGDNGYRFGFLCRGALQLCRQLGWTPDVFHVHDWPTALLPVILNTIEKNGPFGRSASVLTIHNLGHQARIPARDLAAIGIPDSELRPDSLEDFGAVNPLKGGLFHATKLTAVSPRYAQEICTPDGGAGLDGLLRFRRADLVGILNGIDDALWDPSRDPYLPARFGPDDLTGKAVCKRELQQSLGLDVRPEVPLLSVVSRLNEQKGTDVILAALDRILALDAQVVILGSGGPAAEGYLHMRSRTGGGKFRAWIGFDEGLAHRIEAASDLFLMPSRYEPCGLNQLYSQRYGTLPIVRATGGLADTVENANLQTGAGTGFVLVDLNPDSLVETVRWAVGIWREHPEQIRRMQQRAMRKSFGWEAPAAQYARVYEWAIQERRK
jgi:starch synthase